MWFGGTKSWSIKKHRNTNIRLDQTLSFRDFQPQNMHLNLAHTKHVDVALNETVRIVSECFKLTSVEKIYQIVHIAPPTIRRCFAAESERKNQKVTIDILYIDMNSNSARSSLGIVFLRATQPPEMTSKVHRKKKKYGMSPPSEHGLMSVKS